MWDYYARQNYLSQRQEPYYNGHFHPHQGQVPYFLPPEQLNHQLMNPQQMPMNPYSMPNHVNQANNNLLMASFKNKDGSLDFNKMFVTANNLLSTVSQASNTFKSVSNIFTK